MAWVETRKAGTRKARVVGKRSQDRRVIRIDQGPLRQKAASECARMMERVEQARREWERFGREDQPAFARWMAATFGAMLTRLRELEGRTLEKESLVMMIEAEVLFTGEDPHRVYQRIEKERAGPPPKRERREGQDDSNSRPGDGPDFSEERGKPGLGDLFEDMLREVLDLDPRELDKAEYDRMFKEFKEEVFGIGFGEADDEDGPFAGRGSEPPKEARVKELYRVLVRRLHPDSRADNDPTVSTLWHEVQEAYQSGNLDRLETLLALTDLQSNQTGPHTTLSQLKSALTELNRALRALQKSLRGARRDHAWNFARTSDHSQLRERVRRELEASQAELQERLEHLEQVLARMSAPPVARRRRPRRSEPFQNDFFF